MRWSHRSERQITGQTTRQLLKANGALMLLGAAAATSASSGAALLATNLTSDGPDRCHVGS